MNRKEMEIENQNRVRQILEKLEEHSKLLKSIKEELSERKEGKASKKTK